MRIPPAQSRISSGCRFQTLISTNPGQQNWPNEDQPERTSDDVSFRDSRCRICCAKGIFRDSATWVNFVAGGGLVDRPSSVGSRHERLRPGARSDGSPDAVRFSLLGEGQRLRRVGSTGRAGSITDAGAIRHSATTSGPFSRTSVGAHVATMWSTSEESERRPTAVRSRTARKAWPAHVDRVLDERQRSAIVGEQR